MASFEFDRIGARLTFLEKPLPVLHVPFRETLVVLLVLLVAVEDRVAIIDRKGRPRVFQIGLVLVVAHDDERIEPGAVECLAQMRHGGAHLVLPRHQLGRRDHLGHLRIGLFQQLRIGGGPALLVAVLDLLVGLLEARQRLVGGKQHRCVRASGSENDFGHWRLPTENFAIGPDVSTSSGRGGSCRYLRGRNAGCVNGRPRGETRRCWTRTGRDVGMPPNRSPSRWLAGGNP